MGAARKVKKSQSSERANGKLKGKDYERELAKLHIELVKLQRWVVHKGLKVCIVFEGRDGAGKGGTIKATTERVSPRIFCVVALPAPTERASTRFMSTGSVPGRGNIYLEHSTKEVPHVLSFEVELVRDGRTLAHYALARIILHHLSDKGAQRQQRTCFFRHERRIQIASGLGQNKTSQQVWSQLS